MKKIIITLVFFVLSLNVYSSVTSKTLKGVANVSSMAIKKISLQSRYGVNKRLFNILNKIHPDISKMDFELLQAISKKNGSSIDEVVGNINRLGKVCITDKKLDLKVINFALKNKSASFLLKRFPEVKNLLDLSDDKSREIIDQLWRLNDGRSIGFESKKLQKLLSSITPPPTRIRDIAEELVAKAAYHGKIKDIPKGTKLFNANHNGKHGIDYVYVGKNRKLIFGEFSTGKKPSAHKTVNGYQLSDEWSKENWTKYIAKIPATVREQLREAGVPDILLHPETVKKMDMKNFLTYIEKEIIAPEIDTKLADKIFGVGHNVALKVQ